MSNTKNQIEDVTFTFDVTKVKVLNVEDVDVWRGIVKSVEGVTIDYIPHSIGNSLYQSAESDSLAEKGKLIYQEKVVELTLEEKKIVVDTITKIFSQFNAPYITRSILATGFVL